MKKDKNSIWAGTIGKVRTWGFKGPVTSTLVVVKVDKKKRTITFKGEKKC